MRKLFLAAFASFFLVPTFVSHASAQKVMTPAVGAKPLTPFEQELVEQVKRLDQENWHWNVEYVKRVVTPDFLDIDASGNASDRAELLAGLQAASRKVTPEQAAKITEWLYDFQVVPINDSAAVVSFNVVVPFGVRYMRVSTVWLKQDGEWKLKFRQESPNRWSADDL
jgi:hypothetical protein